MTIDPMLAVLGGFTAALAAAGAWAWLRPRRPTPEELERKRRLTINVAGRMADATLTDAREDGIYYTYSVRGIQYMASQDISTLREYFPEDPSLLIGEPVTIKYSTQNPANSIVICEQWSGIRTRPQTRNPIPKEEGTEGE